MYSVGRAEQVLIKAKQKHAPLLILYRNIVSCSGEQLYSEEKAIIYLVSFKLIKKKCMTLMLESKRKT
jgi:hypothetical protein